MPHHGSAYPSAMDQKSKSSSKRTRLNKEAARERILEAAHQVFLEGGADSVKVQPIAKKIGITDAAIHYHFKNRESLLEALLKFGAKKLKLAIEQNTDGNLPDLADHLSSVYDQQGFARLAAWFALAGRKSTQSGMFDELVENQRTSKETSLLEARRQVAFANLILAAEPLFAGALLESVSIEDTPESRRQFHRWIVKQLKQL